MPGRTDWRKIAKAVTIALLVSCLTISSLATHSAFAARMIDRSASSGPPKSTKSSGNLTETAPPSTIQELRQILDDYKPQVSILSPKQNEVLSEDSVSVRFQVRDLPIFREKSLGLGPHLHVLLDNQTYQAVYDLSKPLVFENLQPGTHTIRAFASRPWHESFKNEGAYVQTTFHVLTKTEENSPAPTLPLLTYSRPQGSYGAEPIMLDFYLTNAPLHLVAKETKKDDIADWRIRCTVNGNSFVLDQWQPVYLKGFKPGKNWVQLEFLDENGNPVKNTFNNTARLITYEPRGNDTLSKLVRGELSAAEARGIVDPNYKPEPVPTPTPQPTTSPDVKPTPESSPSTDPSVKAIPSPTVSPVPASPVPVIEPSPASTPKPIASPKPTPSPLADPTPEVVKPSEPVSIPELETAEPFPASEAPEIPKVIESKQTAKPVPIETPKAVKAPLLVKPEPTVSPEPVASPLQPIQPKAQPGSQVDSTKPSLSEKANELKSEFTSQFNKLRESSLKLFRDRFNRPSPAKSSEAAPSSKLERKPASVDAEPDRLEPVMPPQNSKPSSASDEFYDRLTDTAIPSSPSSPPVVPPVPLEKADVLSPVEP